MSYYTHGETHTRLYTIWKSMRYRCSCENWKIYPLYGGRGIKVYDDWNKSYEAFRDWSKTHGYADDLEIDRIDVNGNYTPDNCRWVTHHEQTLNRRDTLYCLVDGVKYRFRDYCIANNFNLNTIKAWRYEGRLEEKLNKITGKQVVVFNGKNDPKL